MDRAKELLAQSDKAIDYWEKRIENGFGDLGPGFRDLLKGQKNVDTGGRSSFAKSSGKSKQKKSRGEEESKILQRLTKVISRTFLRMKWML